MNIIAIGGGGFTHDADPQLEHYLLASVDKAQPNIGFLATASEDDATKIRRFHDRFKACSKPTHLPLSSTAARLKLWVLQQDIIYVGGGNTGEMLKIWKEWGITDIFRIALDQGITLAGVSAGAVCWFETALSDSTGKGLRPLPCLGLLQGSCCAHYNETDTERERIFVESVATGALQSGVGIADGVAVHYRHGEIFNVVSARANSRAVAVEARGNQAVTENLAVNLLPSPTEC